MLKLKKDKNSNNPNYKIIIDDQEITKPLVEVISEFIKYFKKNAIEYYKKETNEQNVEIKKINIAIPLKLNEDGENDLKEAAKKAGFSKDQINLVEQPIAVGIAYGFKFKFEKEKTILFFDIGDSYISYSKMKIKANKYHILESEEIEIGGNDFEEEVKKEVIKRIKDDNKFKGLNLEKNDNKTFIKLFEIKKKVKELISRLVEDDNVNFQYEDLYDDKDFNTIFKKTEYKKMIEGVKKKIEDFLQKSVFKNKKKDEIKKEIKEEIDEVVLVGGTSRSSEIKEILLNYFPEKKILQNVMAEEIAAEGAALSTSEIIHILK